MRRFVAVLPLLMPSAVIAQTGEDPRPRIVVSSAATIPSPPDRAVVSFSVHGEGTTSDEAVRAMVAKRDAIEKGLASISAGSDIRAAQIGIAEVRGRDCNRNTYGNPRLSTGECAIVGYAADIQMEVRTAAVNEAGTMVSLAGRLGATNPRIDRFFLADDKEIRRRGVAEALAEAKLQAEAIARASGVKLGGVLSVSNLSFNGPGPYDDIVVTAQHASAPPPPPPPPPVAVGLKPRAIETQVRFRSPTRSNPEGRISLWQLSASKEPSPLRSRKFAGQTTGGSRPNIVVPFRRRGRPDLTKSAERAA